MFTHYALTLTQPDNTSAIFPLCANKCIQKLSTQCSLFQTMKIVFSRKKNRSYSNQSTNTLLFEHITGKRSIFFFFFVPNNFSNQISHVGAWNSSVPTHTHQYQPEPKGFLWIHSSTIQVTSPQNNQTMEFWYQKRNWMSVSNIPGIIQHQNFHTKLPEASMMNNFLSENPVWLAIMVG